MKVFFILTLIAFISCNNFETVSKFVTCLIQKENLMGQVQNIIKSFKTKDISTIFSTIFSAYLALKDDIMDCLKTKPTLRSLQNCERPDLYQKCKEKCEGPMHLLCKKDCFNCWCL